MMACTESSVSYERTWFSDSSAIDETSNSVQVDADSAASRFLKFATGSP